MNKPRISSLPRLLTCPSSAIPCDEPYSPQSEAASLGTAVHEAMADIVHGAEPDLRTLAESHRVTEDQIDHLVHYGRQAWETVREYCPAPQTEVTLEGHSARGHADVLSRGHDHLTVIDWKTNREWSDYSDQLLGYAMAASEQYGWPESLEIRTVVVWIRLGEMDLATHTPRDILHFSERLREAKRSVGKAYSPGPACRYCPRQLVCQARSDYLRSSAEMMLPSPGAELTRDTLAALYGRSRALKAALEHYDEALRLALAEGPLTDGDGYELSLKSVDVEKLDARKAWGVLLREGLSDDELALCVSIGKTRLLQVVSDKTPRGNKGAAKAELMAELRKAGATFQHHTERISRTRPKKDAARAKPHLVGHGGD